MSNGKPDILPGNPTEVPPVQVPPNIPPDRPDELPSPPQEVPPESPVEVPPSPSDHATDLLAIDFFAVPTARTSSD